MREKPASEMSDAELFAELNRLSKRWDKVRRLLDEAGGAGGSPGEWLSERMGEIEAEMEHREKEKGRANA